MIGWMDDHPSSARGRSGSGPCFQSFPSHKTVVLLPVPARIAFHRESHRVFLSHPGLRVSVPCFVRDHLAAIGVLSYSIYLLHEPLLNSVPWAVHRAFPGYRIHPLLMFAFSLAAWWPILLLSWVFYRYVERPSIRLGKVIDCRDRRVDPNEACASSAHTAADRTPEPVPST